MQSTIRFLSLVVIVSSAFLLAGCGGTPNVKGTVSVRGKPLNTGTVTFRSGDFVCGATSQPDGSYAIRECPPGNYLVTVEVPNLKFASKPNAVPKSAEMPGKVVSNIPPAVVPVAIDSKYREPGLSGLSYTVSSENRNIDIDLQ
jgi:hypothetical protein